MNTKNMYLTQRTALAAPLFLIVFFVAFLPVPSHAQITSTSQLSDSCLNNPSTCTAAENAFLNGQQATFNSSATNQGQAGQTANQGGANATQYTPPAASSPTVCEGFWNFWSSPIICIGRSLGSWLAGALVFITAWILTIAGVLFNWVLDKTVIDFGCTAQGAQVCLVSPAVMNGINTVWTAFRDISNIVIIGMFVFVAISMILDLQEFGRKKMVAQILIIAVLINFSLLFTKIIIDASNFTAKQFYDAAAQSNVVPQIAGVGASQPAAGNANPQNQAKTYGVAGKFMDYAGVAGYLDTKNAVQKLADKIDNGYVATLHGIFTAILLLGAAAVLFYGAFLLISRGILMIFLMMTASLAFASYLLPEKFRSHSYSWSTWWSSLLKNAVFAPVLMFFLWAVLLVAQKLNEQGGLLGSRGSGSVGDLVANPTNPGDVGSLFGYIIILGLLFAAFKISSSFASTIGGFNWASAGPLVGTLLGARLGGILGRTFIGLPALGLSNKMAQGARILNAREEGDKTLFSRAMQGALYYGSKPIKGVAQRDFNAMKTGLGSLGIAGALKDTVKGALSAKAVAGIEGPKVGGAEGFVKNINRRFARQGEELKLTPADKEIIAQREKAQEEDRKQKLKAAAAKAAAAMGLPPATSPAPPKELPATPPTLPKELPATPPTLPKEPPQPDNDEKKKAREEALKDNPDLAKRKSDSDELVKQLQLTLEKTVAENKKAFGEIVDSVAKNNLKNQNDLTGVQAQLKINPQDADALKRKQDIEASIERDKSREKQALSQEAAKLEGVLQKQLERAQTDGRKIDEAIDTLAGEIKKINRSYPRYNKGRRPEEIGAERANKSYKGMLVRLLGAGAAISETEIKKAATKLRQEQREGRIAEQFAKRTTEAQRRAAGPSAPPPQPRTPLPPQPGT